MMGSNRKVLFLNNTRIQLDDGEPFDMPANAELVLVPLKEVVETGILEIHFQGGIAYRPYGGEAKWFVDELGARWVKFRVTRSEGDMSVMTPRQFIRTHVVPAEQVESVWYPEERLIHE